ncbi:hypothetical protein SUGI_0632730 [Cryptomeria japonica]|nr:hypothetical protein SUGI_0632730 [Cryptomeria japonica]
MPKLDVEEVVGAVKIEFPTVARKTWPSKKELQRTLAVDYRASICTTLIIRKAQRFFNTKAQNSHKPNS